MTDELKQILCDLIEQHGRELVREPKRLEGMLNDACAGQHRGARRVLVDAVKERVVEELLALGPSEPAEVVVARAQQRLVDNLAIAPDSARWAIKAWACALRLDGFIASAVAPVSQAMPEISIRCGNLATALQSPFSEREIDAARKEWTQYLGQPMEFEGLPGQKFVLIPPGEFDMGSNESENEQPIHRVRITQPIWAGVTPVTRAQFQAIMGPILTRFNGDDFRPVERVSWLAAIEFCNKLSQKIGRQPCYDIRSEDVRHLDGDGVRLPTEAEWEYSCRAGSTAQFCFENDKARLTEYAWYDENSNGKSHPVGEKRANAFGLHDTHGNVWEWCLDRYHNVYYQSSPSDDPQGPPQKPTPVQNLQWRVLRGGSYHDTSTDARCAKRRKETPGDPGSCIGLRVFCGARSLA